MTTPHIIQTLEHKELVGKHMVKIVAEMARRAIVHDFSKFTEAEAPYFDKTLPRLAVSTFGSPGYQELLDELKPALDNHYDVNSHHPQYYKDGVQGMDLFDLIEMMADWLAATQRHNDGDINKSLAINHTRFNIPDGLMPILENTIEFLTGNVREKKQFEPVTKKYTYCAHYQINQVGHCTVFANNVKYSKEEFENIWLPESEKSNDNLEVSDDIMPLRMLRMSTYGFERVQFTVEI